MNQQLALAIQLNYQANLNNFCWGENTLLQQQLEQSIHGDGEKIIYLWGGPGYGKSHLLQGCCQTWKDHSRSMYLPLDILKEWGPESIEGLENQALLAIDNIDAIAADSQWEEALFHLYNQVRDNGETILLISSQYAPSASPIRLPDLRSRLSWGLVMQIKELSDDLKMITLQQQANKRGFHLPESVAFFLINRCARNMHDLQKVLNVLDDASLAAQRKITVPFVKSILGV
jgi:DnaA family protein